MANTKKRPAKKASSPKKSVSKSRLKKVPVNKMKSFKMYREPVAFMTLKFTNQTLYWLLLLALIAVLTIWIATLQADLTNVSNNLESIINSIQ